MPHNSSQWVTHTIDGGWATDYGDTYYASPQNGQLRIPWLTTCENIKFYADGTFGKYPGVGLDYAAPIKAPGSSSGVIESSFVRNIYSYVKMGSSLSGTVKRVAIVGTWLYSYDSSSLSLVGDISSLGTSSHHLTTFNDLLIIGGPAIAKSWDQSTFQSLAGTPPAFGFSTPHAGRHWAAGVSSAPSRLYYSAVGNPEDWTGSGSGSIDIDPGDGDAIVALLSWKSQLWVFKGPYRLSIHRISGTDPTTFSREPFVYGISAAGAMSIFPVGDDFAFWSPRGTCHSLTTTANYGDYTQGYLNFPILSWCRNPANLVNGLSSSSWQCVTDHAQNVTYSVLNNNPGIISGHTKPLLLVMDWKFRTDDNPYPRFIIIDLNRPFTSIGLLEGRFDHSQLIPTFGTNDGYLLQEYPPDISKLLNGDTAFEYRLITPSLTYGPSVYTKTIMSVSVDIVSNFNTLNSRSGQLDLSYGGPNAPAQTINFATSTGTVLGTFTLDTDQLASENNTPDFYSNAVGESRSFVYTLVENSPVTALAGNDVRVKQFGALITPSGESMETS